MNMKTTLITIAAMIIALVACTPAKKSTTTTETTTPVTTTTTPPVNKNFTFIQPSKDGVRAPGNEELTAIQAKFADITLAKLNEGYTIYTAGKCIDCHNPYPIYDFNTTRWKEIVDDMADRATLTVPQKDAVYKYVLSIKATEPKATK